MPTVRRLAGSATALLTLTVALAGCGQSTAATSTATASSTTPAATTGPALSITDAWCKSAPAPTPGMEAMTGCFGTLTNSGSTAVNVTGGTSSAAAMVQLHVTVMKGGVMTMSEAAGGFQIPPGGFALAPGGNHIMLMNLTTPLVVGDQVEVTLTTDEGEVPVSFTVRDFSGAKESYAPESSMDPMPSHS